MHILIDDVHVLVCIGYVVVLLVFAQLFVDLFFLIVFEGLIFLWKKIQINKSTTVKTIHPIKVKINEVPPGKIDLSEIVKEIGKTIQIINKNAIKRTNKKLELNSIPISEVNHPNISGNAVNIINI